MSEETYDVFAEDELEEQMIEAREKARVRLVEAIRLEVGFRAAVRARTLPGDKRWWDGLWGRRSR